MYKQKLILGVAPVKRSFLSMEEAKRQKDKFMAVIRDIKPDAVEIVDVDDQCENGIMWDTAKVPGVVEKFRSAGVDALFIPFCDFGEEQVAAQIAAAFKLPTLVWGARDERPNSDESRGRDTQCGMFAATKVLRRHGVKYSYIYNCETESGDFRNGYENFLRVAMVLKALKNLRVAKIGERPVPFMSVMTNEANLINRFGVTTIPVSPYAVAERAKKLIADNDPAFAAYYDDLTARMDSSAMTEENVKKAAATKIAIQGIMEENNCSVGAFECWSAFPAVLGVCPCVVLGEMADAGYPLACETDVNGAITLAILRARLPGRLNHPPSPERQRGTFVALRTLPLLLKGREQQGAAGGRTGTVRTEAGPSDRMPFRRHRRQILSVRRGGRHHHRAGDQRHLRVV